MRRTVRWIGGILLFLLIAIIGISLLLLLPAVQTWTAQRLAERVSSELGVEVRIDRVALDPFGPLVLKGVFISDLKGDTLIYSELLAVNGLRIHPRSNSIKAGSLELRDSRFALEKAEGDTYSNLTQLLRKLRSDDPSAAGADWSFLVGEVKIDRMHFTFTDHTKNHAPFGVDFDHLDVRSSIHGRRFFLYKDSIAVKFEKLALADHSGFQLDRLSGAATVSPRGIGIGERDRHDARLDLVVTLDAQVAQHILPGRGRAVQTREGGIQHRTVRDGGAVEGGVKAGGRQGGETEVSVCVAGREQVRGRRVLDRSGHGQYEHDSCSQKSEPGPGEKAALLNGVYMNQPAFGAICSTFRQSTSAALNRPDSR